MAELMEEGHHIGVGQERWHALGRLREVAHTGSNGHLSSVRVLGVKVTAALLKGETSSVTVFALAREQVKVEVAHELALERSSSSSIMD